MIDILTAATRACTAVGTTIDDMRRPDRRNHIVRLRQAVMYLLYPDYSQVVIGMVLQREHSTVAHGCRGIAARIATEPHFAQYMTELQLRYKANTPPLVATPEAVTYNLAYRAGYQAAMDEVQAWAMVKHG